MSALELRRYRTGGLHSSVRVVLARDGRDYVRVLAIEPHMHVERVPIAEKRYMTPLAYPLARAVNKFRKAAKRLGATKGAKRFLQRGQNDAQQMG